MMKVMAIDLAAALAGTLPFCAVIGVALSSIAIFGLLWVASSGYLFQSWLKMRKFRL